MLMAQDLVSMTPTASPLHAVALALYTKKTSNFFTGLEKLFRLLRIILMLAQP
jgi:hypothetical protein